MSSRSSGSRAKTRSRTAFYGSSRAEPTTQGGIKRPSRPACRSLGELAGAYFQRLEQRGLSAETRRSIQAKVRGLLAFLKRRHRTQPAQVRARDLSDFLAALARRRAKTGARIGAPLHRNTVVQYQDTIRPFIRWLVREGELLHDPSLELGMQRQKSLPRVLTRAEVDRLLAAPAGPRAIAVRDRAILELFYSSGLRLGELAGLDLADLDLPAREMTLRQTKGGRWRRVPIGERAVRALEEYLREARAAIPTATLRDAHAVFVSSRGTRLSPSLIHGVVAKRARQARLAGRVSPHTLRHTVAVHLLQGGADVRYVQELLGHVSIETTVHYTKLALADLKAAHARSHPRPRIRA